jgi:hypothetical protein
MNSRTSSHGESSSLADSRWRVLPLGPLPALARHAAAAVPQGLIGLLCLLGIAILGGLISEELLPETAAGTTIDLVGRASAGGVMILGAAGLLLWGLLDALDGPLTARALAARRREGTPATSVPYPQQWGSAQATGGGLYRVFAIVLLSGLGLCYLIVVFVVLGEPDASGAAILAGGALVLGAIAAGIPLTGTWLRGIQQRHAAPLAEHWTQAHRIVAAGREMTEEELAPSSRALPGARAHAVGRALLSVLAAAAGIGLLGLQLMFAVAYPEAERGPGGRAGDRAELEPAGERMVDLIVLGVGIAAAVVLLCVVLVALCEIVARRQEHGTLRRALADPQAGPPPLAALRSILVGGQLPVLKLVHVVAGASAGLGFALWFVDLVADLPDWDSYAGAGPQLRAVGPLGPWIVLGALAVMALGIVLGAVLEARDRVLRDELVQRWPVGPAAPEAPAD